MRKFFIIAAILWAAAAIWKIALPRKKPITGT